MTKHIQKEQGNNRLEKLRMIQLVEADFNMYLKVKISKELMRHAEKHQLLERGMYGGRERCTVHDPIMIQSLLFDITRQQNMRMISINLDAEKCYDRIAPTFATMAMGRLGLPQSVGVTLSKTQESMENSVKTIHGISRKSFKRNENEIWNGIGQGCAHSGPAWLAIEAPMIQVLTKRTGGVCVQSSDGKVKYKGLVLGFIDDNNINMSVKCDLSKEQIKRQVEETVGIWGDMLQVTGGSLSKEKCFYYDVNGTNDLEDVPTDSHYKMGNEVVTVKGLKGSEAQRYLGVRIGPSGNMDEEADFRMEMAG